LKAPRTGGVRFAPSPTGHFHIGNLRTAWVSHQWARALQVPWVVRIEDIDQPRVIPGVREHQLNDLQSLGLVPDILLTQSEFRDRHFELFRTAVLTRKAYPCDCSRKEVKAALAAMASAPNDGHVPVYSGHCRSLSFQREFHAQDSIAWRFRMDDASGCNDFIIARSSPVLGDDGLPVDKDSVAFAYHWACAIDDFDGDYHLIVRSHDLASALPVQRAIQTWIGELEGEARTPPAAFHTALVVQNDGHRLEKRTQGVTLKELLEHGINFGRVCDFFEKSFDPALLNSDVERSAVLGEAKETLRLEELFSV